MKNVLLILTGLFLFVCNAEAATIQDSFYSGKERKVSAIDSINSKDTLVFDLSTAVLGSNYIDIPVYFLSDDTVQAIDFSFSFNESILTYDTIINYNSFLSTMTFFNPTNRVLKFASNSLQQIDNNKPFVSVRFKVISGCGKIYDTDFLNVTAYLKGIACSIKIKGVVRLADFSATSVCQGSPVVFKDNSKISNGTITNWSWNFGDGSTSTQQNPTHLYGAAGTYTATLNITSNQGCTDNISKVITIQNKPVIKFGATVLAGCGPLNVTFKDSSSTSPGSSYLWKFGDNTTSTLVNAPHTYTTSGVYTVKHYVTTSGGCPDSLIKSSYINVYNTPVAKFTAPNSCVGSAVNFSDNSTITSGTISSWKWYFGDGSTSTQKNPTHLYATAGTYTASLKVLSNQGCSDSTSKVVSIATKPIVKFGGNILSGCSPLSVNFTDSSVTSTGSTFLWDFGDKATSASVNVSHTYTVSGIYTVKHYVTNSGGCKDSLIKTAYITVYSLPTAAFSAANGCLGTTTNFTDNSSTSTGTITGWNWNFGDGKTSAIQNPSHTYTIAGTYSVSLSVTNQHCSSAIIKIVTIDAKPVVKFSSGTLSGCTPLTVNFTDSSTTVAGSSYLWNFGDQGTSSSVNASHTYTASGIYNVSHYVTAPSGCTDSLIRSSYITVYGSPTAAFSSANGCLGTITNFTDNSSIPSGTITSWNWNFGDGNTSSLQSPVHTYTTAGTYSVNLNIISDKGCSGNIVKTVTIESKPIVNFSADSLAGCVPLSVNFSDASTTAPGSSFFWNFGNSVTSVLMNPSYTYTASAIYSVTHIVTTSAGCKDTLIKSSYINVHPVPTASFTATPDTAILPNASVTFVNLSSITSNWLWNFGDGASSNVNSPVHTYSIAGTYTVCLNAYNSFGCLNSVCNEVNINANENPVGVPTGFTPNGDNSNDILYVRGGPMDEMDWKIFNEWGTVIFQTNSQKVGWDGKFKDAAQPEGAYVYILKGITKDKRDINIHGIVNLIR